MRLHHRRRYPPVSIKAGASQDRISKNTKTSVIVSCLTSTCFLLLDVDVLAACLVLVLFEGAYLDDEAVPKLNWDCLEAAEVFLAAVVVFEVVAAFFAGAFFFGATSSSELLSSESSLNWTEEIRA